MGSMQQDVLVVIRKLSNQGGGKSQGQTTKPPLLLFERKAAQCLSRLGCVAGLQQSHSLTSIVRRNCAAKPLSDW